jgi:hypothetical protein
MATYRDPVRCFAPLEVVERLHISTRLASMSTLCPRPNQNFTLATIELLWRRAVIMRTTR